MHRDHDGGLVSVEADVSDGGLWDVGVWDDADSMRVLFYMNPSIEVARSLEAYFLGKLDDGLFARTGVDVDRAASILVDNDFGGVSAALMGAGGQRGHLPIVGGGCAGCEAAQGEERPEGPERVQERSEDSWLAHGRRLRIVAAGRRYGTRFGELTVYGASMMGA
jgi:hypothetical protein